MIARVPLRVRIAAAFVAASALAMVALGTFVQLRFSTTLSEQNRAALESRMDTLAEVPPESRIRAIEQLAGTSYGQVLAADGQVLGHSPGLASVLVTDLADEGFREAMVLLPADDERERSILLVRRAGGQVLVLGSSLETEEEAREGLQAALWIGGPLALLISGVLGYLVAGLALRPVERMRRRAETISGATGQRLPVPEAHDELRRLGTTLNQMLDRLDAGLIRERRFVAEAGHELRTPLTLLRAELDLALSRARTPDELLATLQSVSEDVDRLISLADDLVLLAGATDAPASQEPVDVTALLRELANRYRGVLAEDGREIRVADQGSDVVARGDLARLERALVNLVDNAARHGAGNVELAVELVGDRVEVTVADDGPGLGADLVETATTPFSRSGPARIGPGHGLGLAIVRALVEEQQQGQLRLTNREGGGFAAVVELPISRDI